MDEEQVLKPSNYQKPNKNTCRKCEYSESVEYEGEDDYHSSLICCIGENSVDTDINSMDEWEDLIEGREVDSLGSCPCFMSMGGDD